MTTALCGRDIAEKLRPFEANRKPLTLIPDHVSLQDIMRVPRVASVCPPNECETFESQQVASDCMWSDPAKDDQVPCQTLPFSEQISRTRLRVWEASARAGNFCRPYFAGGV